MSRGASAVPSQSHARGACARECDLMNSLRRAAGAAARGREGPWRRVVVLAGDRDALGGAWALVRA